MSGSNSLLYWSTTFIFDIVIHALICSIILLIFLLNDKNKLFINFDDSIRALFLLLFVFGLTAINLVYVFSRSFNSVSTGFLTIVVFNLVFGVILVIFDFFFDYLNTSDHLSKDNREIIIWIFRFFPIYALSRGISNLYLIGSKAQLCQHLYDLGINKYCNSSGQLNVHIVKECCIGI